jgi:hypothetical protein
MRGVRKVVAHRSNAKIYNTVREQSPVAPQVGALASCACFGTAVYQPGRGNRYRPAV